MKRSNIIRASASWLILALLGAACGGLPGSGTPTPEAEPIAQGTRVIAATGIVVPARYSTISFSTGGIVEEILVEENQVVTAGQVLLRLKGSEALQAAIAAARLELASAQHARDLLDKNPELRIAEANRQVALALRAVRDAQRARNNLGLPAAGVDIEQAQANVAILKDRMEKAQEDYEPYANKPEDNLVRAALLSKKAQAEKDYDNAVRRLNNMLLGANDLDIVEAEADLALAQAQLVTAQRDYETYQAGPNPEEVSLADERLANARAQLAAAQAALEDLELAAPFAGTVSELFVHTSEWVVPGQAVLLLADLGHLQVETTDLNEIDVARISLGRKASITFDALPDVQTSASVVRIASKAAAGSGVNYTVVLELAEPPTGLLWGMTAFVDIEAE